MFTDGAKAGEEGKMADERDVRHGNKEDFWTEHKCIKEPKKKKGLWKYKGGGG